MTPIAAVIFDLGGVVLGSPLHAIAAYERDLGIPDGFVNRVVADTAPAGAWSRLERGELTLEAFYPAFEMDCAAAGNSISAREMLACMQAASLPRRRMLAALDAIRSRGLKTAALTNNWATQDPGGGTEPLRGLFDVFVESSVVGLRKPDPRIYAYACQELGVQPSQAVFLDDIGSNLKPARAMGMTTLKVEDADAALEELAEILGFPLGNQ
ncbi:MAG: HAD family phosphatase [Myxococcota bacterium]|nr:HAD family phosphatase [bacterium]MDP6073409.1 HAD family phosphatase [Myxococcota bacterium]MDP6244424.1 HAD family phosphatase [Myxococcota bacterium]MDP7075601.1 HAD family phosphatase [Myxococcota bacterium]MDP7298685.1 HAD family phosphatase [Myxococcota bacterium]